MVRLRVAFICHCMAPLKAPGSNVGGMQRAARELLHQLQRSDTVGVRPLVVAAPLRQMWWRVPLFITALPARLLWLAWTQRIDAVVFASLNPALVLPIVVPFLPRSSPHLIAITHGSDVIQGPPIWQWLVRASLARLDAVFSVSGSTAEQCTQRGVPSQRLTVLPNAVPEAAASRALRTRCRRPLPPKQPGTFLLLGVGRQIPRKGFSWFVDAVMPRLEQRIHLWLVGHGPEAAAIQRAIQRHGLEGRVALLGEDDTECMPELYEAADLFVMPNVPVPQEQEGFPMVLLEAGRQGLFTLASNLPGITAVISPDNGIVLPAGDPQAYAIAIEAQASLLPEQRAIQSQAAQTWICNQFSWSTLRQQYFDALSAVCRQPCRRSE